MYTYIATYVNGVKEEIKAANKKAARQELNRLTNLQLAPKLKALCKKY